MSEIKISGSTQNLKVLFDALALTRSSKSAGNAAKMIFPRRKVIVVKRPTGSILFARQKANSIYSQVLCKTDVETPFINLEGEGDVIFNMEIALKRLSELSIYKAVSIVHNTETNKTVFRGSNTEEDYEEWGTHSSGSEIDDARNELPMACDCGKLSTCPKCSGSGITVAPELSYKNKIILVPPEKHPYAKVDIQFEIDSSTMRTIGDKTEQLLDETYPLGFTPNSLLVFAGDAEDISNDNFKKHIPLTYIVNNMVGKNIVLGSDFRNVFGSLNGKLMITSEDTDPKKQSVYISKNDMGFHTGIKMQTKLRDVD
ncbi:MAG: hypothetical protein WC623_22140 [Pedobacter sp.]|uniref:hypothetical protein n=1 Tax=Pedobacter sp. TaxID=1411316 RepID=UPI003567FA9A